MKYFVVRGNKIINVLDEAPTYIPEGHSVLRYNGFVPIKHLECRDGVIVPKEDTPHTIDSTEQYKATAITEIKDVTTKLIHQVNSNSAFGLVGYESIFAEKVEQAMDYLSDSSPIDTNYPLLFSEARALSTSLLEVARNTLDRKKKWMTTVSKIDELFISGISQIEGCTDETSVHEIKNKTITSLLQLK